MAYTDINSEDRLVQETFANYLRDKLGWENVYAYNHETFGPRGTLGRESVQDAVLLRELRDALARLNPGLPEVALAEAFEKLTQVDAARSLVQHNREFYRFIRDGVPVAWHDADGQTRHAHARVIDFRNGSTDGRPSNRFIAVRELKMQGRRVPHYHRRADLVCFVNGLPLVFIELKAVYRNIRQGFEDNLTDYMNESWQCGKSMLVCIDKLTCARMYQRIMPLWQARTDELRALVPIAEAQLAATSSVELREKRSQELKELRERIAWMESTIVEIVISEAQNEVRDFAKWGFDIIPHPQRLKKGFVAADDKNVPVDDAFKDPKHPFRVAIVCAMWLTGFDVECLQTLYIDKPLRAHTLMQAIARANRVYPGKDCGLIVDYNGMLKSLRQALAQYAVEGDDDGLPDDIVAPIETLVAALVDALNAIENHLRALAFDPGRLVGATGFARIAALRDAVEALLTSDEQKRRFEIMAREVFSRFKALVTEPSVIMYAERHDNIEAIYKKLEEKRDTADVTKVLKEPHLIVNAAIRAAGPGEDHADGLTVDLSQIDFERLRKEFAKSKRKNTTLKDIRDVVEQKLKQMVNNNPARMDYYRRYQEIVADYNREKDRATVEQTFAALMKLADQLDEEQLRAVNEGLTEGELALFDLLRRENLTKAELERLKQASKMLLSRLRELLAPMEHWTRNAQTQAEVKASILDWLYESLPRPPFTDSETDGLADRVYGYVWQRSQAGGLAPEVSARNSLSHDHREGQRGDETHAGPGSTAPPRLV
ncbi:MAG TPA: type I restriction endonuclease [Pirellulales bacterium]|nr:type I restriction endonuclease [Pirellulales bacterium]